jgi:glutamate racemase
MKIGFFDSGLGGLTILKAVARALPAYDYEYFGDTAHLPYGDKTEVEIFELSMVAMRHLFARDCSLVIIACNTASAETLRKLQDEFLPLEFPDRRILGVIIPTVETVIASGVDKVGLVATKRTVESGKYEREFAKFSTAPQLFPVATPGLVPLIEAGQESEALESLAPILDNFLADGVEGLILGCTHYTVLKEQIQNYTSHRLTIFSQDDIIPTKLEQYLGAHPEIASHLSELGRRNIHLSAVKESYDPIITHLLGGVLAVE